MSFISHKNVDRISLLNEAKNKTMDIMTPKEKALSLCQQFGSTTKFAEDCNDGKTLPLRVAKLCATIAVDEILNQYQTGKFDYKILDEEEAIHWKSVKSEIERL